MAYSRMSAGHVQQHVELRSCMEHLGVDKGIVADLLAAAVGDAKLETGNETVASSNCLRLRHS